MTTPLDSTVEILTPENIAFRYHLAGPFRRLPAFAVDLLIRLGAMLALSALALLLQPTLRAWDVTSLALLVLIWFALEWFYGGLFESYWNGQTPGKWLFRLRVVSMDGRPINGVQALLRNILRAADLLPWVPLLPVAEGASGQFPACCVAVVAAACNPRFQRLGDIVCGTMVISEEPSRGTVEMSVAPGHIVELARQIPPSFRPTRRLVRALAVYHERRRFFSATRRQEIARHLAEPLMRQWGLPPHSNLDDVLQAAYYHVAFQPQATATV